MPPATTKTTMTSSYRTEDRQWDCRINVQTEDYFANVLVQIQKHCESGAIKYVLVGGIEIGTKPTHSDYQVKHVHIAVIFHNRISKSAILKKWGVIEGNGYYLEPRNRDLPYEGWRKHHTKVETKIDTNNLVLYEYGELPKDVRAKKDNVVYRSAEEKKRKLDDVLIEMRGMIEENKEEEAFHKFPRTFLIYGARLKAMVAQKNTFFKERTNPHIWLYGFAGSGKTAILKYVYPTIYKKDLSNRFFDLYDETLHTHVMLEDFDPECMERLGLQFVKTMCDEAGFCYDQKYKTPQLGRTTVLITSNYTIQQCIPEENKDPRATLEALLRRFFFIRIDNFLRFIGFKLIDKYERNQLKLQGNEDVSKIFMSWNYLTDSPTGKPLATPEELQEKIRNHYFTQ